MVKPLFQWPFSIAFCMFTYGEIAPPRSPRLTDSLAPFYTVGRWSQPRGDGGDRNEKNWGCLWGYYPLVMSK